MHYQRFRHAIGQQVAQADIDNKAWKCFYRRHVIPEGKQAIEYVTENASKKVIRYRGDPIAEMKHVIEHKHNSCSKYRVCNTNQNKFPKGGIKKLAQ